MKKEVKTIILTLDTYKRLRALRNQLDAHSLNETVEHLLKKVV